MSRSVDVDVNLVHSSWHPASDADWRDMLRFCEQESHRAHTPRDVRVSAVRHMRQWMAGGVVNAAAGAYTRDDIVVAWARQGDMIIGLMWGGVCRGIYSSMRTVIHPEWTYGTCPMALVSSRMWSLIFDYIVRRVVVTRRSSVDFVLAEETCIQDHGRRWWNIYRRTAHSNPDIAMTVYPSIERGQCESEWTRGIRGNLTRWKHGSPILSVLAQVHARSVTP